MQFIVRHIPDHSAWRFEVLRDGGRGVAPVEVVSPIGFPVSGRPSSDLIRELAWYLETFLDYPFPPRTEQAEQVVEALGDWGTQAFNALFGSREAGRLFDDATREHYADLRLRIMSEDPMVLQWPWEALRDPQGGYVGLQCRVERCLDSVRDPIPADRLPRDRVNILLVTARPKERDVGFRSISRSLVELIEEQHIPAHVHVLRPPTFGELRRHLRERPGFYHILHFDGHGGYREGTGPPRHGDGHSFRAADSVLLFETEDGGPDEVSSEQLAELLREYAVPIMVLNACQSAMLDETAADPFASVAASLVKAGSHGVVAMAYSLMVSAAQRFLPAFYERLFATGDLSLAVTSGRQRMFEDMGRVCARGRHDLRDFIIPVLYQQEPFPLSFDPTGSADFSPQQRAPLPEEVSDEENPYGFIGRDRELLRLERAMRRSTPAILIDGIGGVGKTTLARGLARWLHDTDGMDACLWLGFGDIYSADYVINAIGGPLLGSQFLPLPLDDRIRILGERLRENRVVIVWDNFEVVAGNPDVGIAPHLTQGDRDALLSFLKKLRGGKTKVIITSRSDERWLGEERLRVPVGGLVGEERWELCDTIIRERGLRVPRDDADLARLMDLLDGHPLGMRVVLPRMEGSSAAQLIAKLESYTGPTGGDADKFYAVLHLATDDLAADLRPLLVPLALHERYADAAHIEAMAEQADASCTRAHIDRLFSALTAAGVVRPIGQNVFELHPALTGFIRSTALAEAEDAQRDAWTRAFVDSMGAGADHYTPRPLHEQRGVFHIHGANFRSSLDRAGSLGMHKGEIALTRCLAAYAQNERRLDEAQALLERLAGLRAAAGDEDGNAETYHQLGMVAEDRRDFEAAEQWYLRSLAIKEKLGYERGAAVTYHQLGVVAQRRRDLDAAEQWYLRSLAIKETPGGEDSAATYHQLGAVAEERRDFDAAEQWLARSLAIEERLGDEPGAASTCHHLGRVAQERRDFDAAEQWYLRSLAIREKLEDEHGAASTYHHIGMVAQEQRDFAAAEQWFLRSLEISEKLGDEHSAASTYHQLGIAANDRQDFALAEQWFLRSLVVKEKLGDEHGAAATCSGLGVVAAQQDRFEDGASWLVRCIRSFLETRDPEEAARHARNYAVFIAYAPAEDAARMLAMWEAAGLGPLPEVQDAEQPAADTQAPRGAPWSGRMIGL